MRWTKWIVVPLRAVLGVSLLAGGAPAKAADGPQETMIVTGAPLHSAPPQATQETIDGEEITATRPLALSDVLERASAASIQTNSRGETLVFLRNSGERQVAVFYDGSALNVPWDNRLDLALIPADALAGIAVTKGPVSVRYGPNSSGGAVELIPRSPGASITELSLRLSGGEAGLLDAGAMGLTRLGPVDITAAAGHIRRDGAPLSSNADLAFSQSDDRLRTNTDLTRTNAMARIAFDGGDIGALTASFLYVDADFGIAPEGDRDPLEESVRFWRYPDTRHFAGILHGVVHPGAKSDLEASLWVQDFDQTIESFTDATYGTLADRQIDENLTVGLRSILTHRFGDTLIRGIASGLMSTHHQTDFAVLDGDPPSEARFRQRVFSLAAEVEHAVGPDIDLLLGAGADWMDPVETGGRPEVGTFRATNAIGGVRWRAGPAWSLRWSAGVKERLPTLRELFDTAIDRFLINPDLQPERSLLTETAVRFEDSRLDVEIVPFASLVSDTIDQRVVTVDGRDLRQRINLEGSRVIGVEMTARAVLTEYLSAAGHLTVSRTRAKPDGDGGPRLLAERPNRIARLGVTYDHPSGFSAKAEILHRGKAFSLTDEDLFVPLDPSSVLNLEIGWTGLLSGSEWRAFVRADNLTDALVLPQAGLPGPGRTLRGGISVAL